MGFFMHTIIGKRLLMLKPSQIKLPLGHPRKDNHEEMKRLTRSIAKNGIIEPIAVRKDEDGTYILIAGQRRLKCAVLAGLRRVPCVLHKIDSNLSAIYSLTENLQKSPLSYLEQTLAFERIIKIQKITPATLANSIGITESYVHNKLQLARLTNDLRGRIEYAKLDEDYARLLLLLPEYQRPEILNEIISESLSLSESEELINSKLNPIPTIKAEKIKSTEPQPKPIRKSSIGDMRIFGNSLNKLVETLENSGISAKIRKTESVKYIEYKVRIYKDVSSDSPEFTQLSIV